MTLEIRDGTIPTMILLMLIAVDASETDERLTDSSSTTKGKSSSAQIGNNRQIVMLTKHLRKRSAPDASVEPVTQKRLRRKKIIED
jgi:hypothetical protein